MNPWPIDDARHNLVEIGKELTLLEGHLAEMGRNCVKCITKHCLTLSALAEEGRRLTGGDQLEDIFAATIDAVDRALWRTGVTWHRAQQGVRMLRRDVITALLRLKGRPNVMPGGTP